MTASPLISPVLFEIGPVPITEPVVVTWGLMLLPGSREQPVQGFGDA